MPTSDDADYEVIALGLAASIAPVVALTDRSRPANSRARVRVFHGAPSAPNVDVYVLAPGASIDGANPVLADVPFRAISDYLTVDSGTYDLKVTIAGSKNVEISADVVVVPFRAVITVAAFEVTLHDAGKEAILLPTNCHF